MVLITPVKVDCATHAPFSLSLMPEATYLLKYSILSATSMPEVVELGSCPIFLSVEFGSLT